MGGEGEERQREAGGLRGGLLGSGLGPNPRRRSDGDGLSSASPLPENNEAGYIFKKPNCKQLWRCQNSPQVTRLRGGFLRKLGSFCCSAFLSDD